MEISRNAFLENVGALLHEAPEKVLELCSRLFDSKEKCESREAELRKQINVIRSMYESREQEFRDTYRENERLDKLLVELRGKLESMNRECVRLEKCYEDAQERIVQLEDALAGALQEKVEAVHNGRALQERLDAALEEKEQLDDRVRRLQEQISLGNKDRFGHTTEKTSELCRNKGMEGDPLAEDAPCDGAGEADTAQEGEGKSGSNGSYSADEVLKKIHNKTKKGKEEGTPKTPKPRKTGRKDKIFDTITDYVHFYDYDFDELDRKYGKGRYEIVDFECYKELRETRPHNYAFCTYTPVVVVKDDAGGARIVSLGKKDNFYPGSFASASLVASVLYKRFALAVPLYRLEQEYKARNVLLTRQTMSNWILKFALERFGPVYDWMARELGERCRIQQCDETTWRVIIWPEEEDGTQKKPNGSKGYVWVHTSSELGDGRKIILYCFEKTRSADHLRAFLSDLVTWLVSDAYSGYIAMEKERGGALGVANCWMHCRRAWARACVVMEKGIGELTVSELLQEKAVKGLMLSNDIFVADTPLKGLGADERKARRLTEVAPLVDEFFEFVHSIDLDDPEVTGKLREAVVYSLNQEERLKVFLKDGNIPLDNGYCERCVKPIALSRRNSLFSYSMAGAESNAIVYSVVETAKANGADVYTYLKYLLTEVPKYLDGSDTGFLADMMPWSPVYKVYERQAMLDHADERMPESNNPPPGMGKAPTCKCGAA